MSALLSLRSVGKRYRRGELARWLLRDVSLELDAGEVVSVVAMRSQGKTTLLRIAAGMTGVDEGRVLLGRTDLTGLSDAALSRVLRERIGWAGRGGPGIGMQMLDYVALRLAIGGRRQRRDVQTLALKALERVGMEHCAGCSWEELSDWERALVELAQAFAGAPELLLIDDALDGLGMRETEELGALVHTLARDLGIAVLMSASDVEAALSCDRVLSLTEGRLTSMSESPGCAPENVIDFPRVERRGRRGARV
jgi:putative ABC transport system ATP-binding protein